jgi:hypothetical protein
MGNEFPFRSLLKKPIAVYFDLVSNPQSLFFNGLLGVLSQESLSSRRRHFPGPGRSLGPRHDDGLPAEDDVSVPVEELR